MGDTAIDNMRKLYCLALEGLCKWRTSQTDILNEYGHIAWLGIAHKPADIGDGVYDEFMAEWRSKRIELEKIAEELGIAEQRTDNQREKVAV